MNNLQQPPQEAIPTRDGSLDFAIYLLPYRNSQERLVSLQKLEEALNKQVSGDAISPEELRTLIAHLSDEQADQELSLEQLEQLSAGVGLVDAMVSSSILMVVVSQSANLFGSSMNAMSNSQLRDGLNAAISADIEQVRHQIANWATAADQDGQLTYAPSSEACEAAALAEALLIDQSAELPLLSNIDLSNAPTRLQGTTINRNISVDPNNKNLILISYVTADSSPISVNQKTTLATPAQGWCP